ncbi:quaternary amine ABC transporter ATP-binding protein [Maledivibacter halophilus]|uniref:Quaternary amine transport ATP-binding protein n=1 Tax=Maledivibacter halophilus TaxID=36842 RepID=A0A1T5M7P1_9FIRM|nr:glycine betaine/L-proline ABC transporter ATP-binding protein [Maledivibacter halophilus]SKC84257.1 glycine betaine/proline transport system ATP-binding protein [Maledivibacter halophilus]
MEKIEVQNLSKVFGHNPKRGIKMIKDGYSKKEILEKTGLTVGVNNVNFDIKQNEIFVIMGLSGSGKSTLLRCLNRLIQPTSGKVIIDNTNITSLDKNSLREIRKKKFAMVFQNFGLLPYKTVLENAEFGLEVQEVSKDDKINRAREALKKVGLESWEDKYPDELSGGMQQRVGLARALAVDPDILLMDEPFSALDPLIKREMQDLLLDIYEGLNKTIVFITHDLDEALKLGDRIAIMKDGEIVQLGTPEEILINSKNEYVEEFVKNVNRSIVLTAGDIMVKPVALLYENDGLEMAKYKMSRNKISSIFAVSEKRKYRGIVHFKDVYEAIGKGKNDISKLIKNTKIARPDDTINDLSSDIATSNVPLPIVDEDNNLLGIIVKGTILANI